MSKHNATRIKNLAKMKWPTTQQGWVKRWKKSLSIIRDKITNLWEDRETYREFRHVIDQNANLDKSAGFFHLVHDMYVNHVLVSIRTFADKDLRAFSLYNLVEEIRDHADQLDRTWFVKRFGRNRKIAEMQYRQQWNGKAHISKHRVDRDLRSILRSCERIKKTVDKYLAHNDRRKGVKLPTYGEIDAALDDLFAMVARYHGLIFNSHWGTPATLSSHRIYRVPWLSSGAQQ